MRRMHLDFVQPHARRTALGFVLLVVGAAAVYLILTQYLAQQRETIELEGRIADAQRAVRREMPRLRVAGGRVLAQEVRVANAVIEHINIPWDRLFRELEAATGADVALLAIQPDPGTGQIRISGEARKLDAVLEYIRRLEARDGLSNVLLLGHELKDTPSRPVAFTLSAEWRETQ
jgi:Tfp pilus assembly protein PilN